MIRRSALAALLVIVGCTTEPQYDLVLLGGTVVDGTGGAARPADVAVTDGRIAAIGDLSQASAEETVDVAGLVVAPGFIDVHSHADDGLVDPELGANRGFLTQGVTTAVYGADGAHAPARLRELRSTFAEHGVGNHYLFYVGHNGVRTQVMGTEPGPPSDEQLEAMKSLVREGMEEGAVGLSTGLMYLPGRFSQTDEVVALAEVAAAAGGLYDSHVRDPANALLASHGEAIEIGERSGARPHLGHIKAVGGRNFGTGPELVALAEAALERGTDVTADQYPYDGAAAAQLATILVPPADHPATELLTRLMQGGLSASETQETTERYLTQLQDALRDDETANRIRQTTEAPPAGVFSWVDTVGYTSFRLVVTERDDWLDRMITEIAESEGLSPWEVIRTLVLEEGLNAKITLGAIQEDDVRLVMRQPWVMIASDGAITGFEGGGGHPRHRGTFPRVLGRYVREWGVLTLEEAVRKMTSLPAEYLRLDDRGRLAQGLVADLTIFDPETVIDRSTWKEPELFSEGVVHVLLEGRFALRDGELTGERPGRDLSR